MAPDGELLPRTVHKGQNVGLQELDAELGSVAVNLETGGSSDGNRVDADVSVILLGVDGAVRSNDDVVFYNQPVAVAGAVHYGRKSDPKATAVRCRSTSSPSSSTMFRNRSTGL